MDEMSLRKGAKWAIAIAAVIAAGGTGTYFFLSNSERPAAVQQQQENTIAVRKGNIRLSVSGTSQFQTQDMQNITAPADGTIKTINLARTKAVKKGDLLLEISNPSLEASLKESITALENLQKELDDLLEQQNNLRITAPASGELVLNANLDVGSSVSKSAKLGTVSVISSLVAKLPFPLEEAQQFKAGDPVDLDIAGFPLTKTGAIRSIGRDVKADGSGNRVVDVEIAVENDGTLKAGLSATGSVVLNGREIAAKGSAALEVSETVSITSGTTGTIAELRKKTGDVVKAGEVIAIIENDNLQDQITAKEASIERQKLAVEQAQKRVDDLKVYAPFDGVFSTDFFNQRINVLARYPVGGTVEAGNQFGAVASLDVMTLPVQIDELDLTSIKPGLKAEVTVDAIPGKVFQGEVLQVSTVGTTTNGVTYYDAIVGVPNPNQELKYGMTGTAEILIEDKRDVLVLPVEALRIQRGNASVTVKREDGTKEEVPVKIGVRSETMVEVVEGVKEGDRVVIPTRQRSQNASQQQINQIRSQFQQGGGFPAGGGGGFPAGGGGGFPAGGGGGFPAGGGGFGGGGGR
jgi:HlyD family secretion protein